MSKRHAEPDRIVDQKKKRFRQLMAGINHVLEHGEVANLVALTIEDGDLIQLETFRSQLDGYTNSNKYGG